MSASYTDCCYRLTYCSFESCGVPFIQQLELLIGIFNKILSFVFVQTHDTTFGHRELPGCNFILQHRLSVKEDLRWVPFKGFMQQSTVYSTYF